MLFLATQLSQGLNDARGTNLLIAAQQAVLRLPLLPKNRLMVMLANDLRQ